MIRKRSWCLLPALLFALSIDAQEQQFANLGSCQLASGETIQDCRIGYRTFGKLNADKSNAILWVPNFTATSEWVMTNYLMPLGLANNEDYFFILVDAFGNGVSSSPSNSESQRGALFPTVTLEDVVDSHYRLVAEKFGIDHLHAVIGASMGGVQVFQWLASHPDFMDRGIAMNGSPRPEVSDLMVMDAIRNSLQQTLDAYPDDPDRARAVATSLAARVLVLGGRTQHWYNTHFTRDQVPALMSKLDSGPIARRLDPYNWLLQIEAMRSMDISSQVGEDFENAATAIHADVLVIVSRYDHMLYFQPNVDIARALGTEAIVLEGDCGHRFRFCEADFALARERIWAFLAQ